VWRHAHQFTRPELVGEVAELPAELRSE